MEEVKNEKKNYRIMLFLSYFLLLVFFLLSFIFHDNSILESALRKKKKHRPGYEANPAADLSKHMYSFSIGVVSY